jgi:TPR repeat protein
MRALRTLGFALLLVVAASGTAAAEPERRVALVIGNNHYVNVGGLEKAVPDARLMAETLRSVGFEVIEREDLDRRAINLALGQFVDKIGAGGVGLLYFAGHGVQIGGSNYLLPIDVPALSNQEDLRDEAIDLGRVMERISDAKAKLSILIIDACRDNPFPRVSGRSVGGTRGLTIPAAPSGILIVYSAGVNETAIDSLGPNDDSPNGLFTRKLVPFIKKPGLRLYDAVRQARKTVADEAKAAGGSQNPAIYDQTDGDFFFVGGTNETATAAPAATGNTPIVYASESPESTYWKSIENSSDPRFFEAYLNDFPQGNYTSLARIKLEMLKAKTRVATASPGAIAPSAPASAAAENDAGKAAVTARNYAEAMRHFRAAADQGFANAQHNIGLLYANGWGVTQDYGEAASWFFRAADQGLPAAQFALGTLYVNGTGVDQDYGQALTWFRRAADQGLAEAQLNLGMLYFKGSGVEQDYGQALTWFRKAADQGVAAAQNNVGFLYNNGLGIEADYKEAMAWYRKAADHGYAIAQRNIGWLYAKGHGVPQDKKQARLWMSRAADGGDETAKTWLAEH